MYYVLYFVKLNIILYFQTTKKSLHTASDGEIKRKSVFNMAPKSVKVHGLWKSKDPPYIYSIALYKFNGLFFIFFLG